MNNNPAETDDDDQYQPSGPSYLFLLRLGVQAQDEAEGQTNWYGRFQDPITGATREFSGWAGLREAILHMMAYRQSLGG